MRRHLLLGRARVDRIGYLLGRTLSTTLLVTSGVLVGVLAIVPSIVAIPLSFVILGLAVTAVLRHMRHLRRRWASHEFAVDCGPFPIDELPPPDSYPDAVYLSIPNRGTALVCDAIDRHLTTRQLPLSVAKKRYRPPSRLRATAPYVLPRTARDRVAFNGTLIGLRGDPPPGVCLTAGAPTLHHLGFFDFLCSNDICRYQITHRETGVAFEPQRELLADERGRLRLLAESKLSDLIGVSTIAVTRDGVLVLTHQSARNSASANLLAPSGSGSLEPQDLNGATSLQDAVRRGMERELSEETGLRANQIESTRVIGFARWMERGAKPEFFGLTTLRCAADDLASAKLANDEYLFGSALRRIPLDLAALRRELQAGTELLNARNLPRQIREQGALPLLLALRAAAANTSRSPHIPFA